MLFRSGKIGTLAFVPSNSENIHFLTFLEPKTAENRQLALWLLLIGYVGKRVGYTSVKSKFSTAYTRITIVIDHGITTRRAVAESMKRVEAVQSFHVSSLSSSYEKLPLHGSSKRYRCSASEVSTRTGWKRQTPDY